MKLHICPYCGYDDTTPDNPSYITPGTILHDRYLIGIMLEANGEGATYAGHDMSTGCKVLIREYMPVNLCTRVTGKSLINVHYNDLAKYKAFMAEYTELNKSLARLRSNSNINHVLDMFSENNTTYTVYEYIDGIKMVDYLKENAGELSWGQVSKIFPPLFTTIGILHNSGLIHRGISPETIYINSKGELKLAGFCVSAVRTADAGLECELYRGYSAPEQYSGSSRQGSWTDVYGICALLYRALTGCMPVESTVRMKQDDLLEPCKINGSIPPHVSRVIMDGMNLSGRDRIQTITELVTRLFEHQPAETSPEPVRTDNFRGAAPVRNGYPAPVPNNYNYNNNNYNNYNNNNNPPRRQQPAYRNPPVQQRNYYPPPQERNYTYEEVNTVDRLKVPVLIGILLFGILLIISVVIMQMVTPKKSPESDIGESSSISDNVVSGETETTETETETSELNTEMPDLIGKFYEITEPKWSDFLVFDPTYEYNDEYESDMIFEQSIDPGTQISSGSVVKIKISKGRDNAVIPEYENMTYTQYETKLKEAGIQNYSLVVSEYGWGTPEYVVSLQIDGKDVQAGDKFSNKEGKKLMVYYIAPDTGNDYSSYDEYSTPEYSEDYSYSEPEQPAESSSSVVTPPPESSSAPVESSVVDTPPESSSAPVESSSVVETPPESSSAPEVSTPPESSVFSDPNGGFVTGGEPAESSEPVYSNYENSESGVL